MCIVTNLERLDMNIEKQNQQKMDNLIIKEFILTVVAVFLIVGAVAFVIKNARFTEQPKPAVVQDVKKPLTQQEQQNQRRLTTAIILMAG